MNASDLPLPDYDHLPTGALAHRIRSLDADGVQDLLDHERAHADRVPVVSVLKTRLSELRSGAEPSDGSPLGEQPEQAPAPVSDPPASPDTQGPPVNPPSQGDPTNPAQPRS